MFPLFRAGRDSVCIRPCSSVTIEKPKRGDIILFCISGKYILHRVMRIEGNRVVTAGDGNRGFDAFASPQNPLRLIPLSKQSEQPNDSSSLNDSDESERTGELLGIAEARIRGGHKLDFNSPAYRIPAALWRLLFPLRPALLRLFGSAARLRHRFLRNRTENKYIFINSILYITNLKEVTQNDRTALLLDSHYHRMRCGGALL